MALINENYLKLKAGYLFPEISRRVSAFQSANSDKKLIKLGIGDVTKPLTPTITAGFESGVKEMASEKSFRGYGPSEGYLFLRELIAKYDFNDRGADILPSEIFISDGSKCDSGNIQEIFGLDNIVAVSDPVYPVYVDTNVMAGRTGEANDDGSYEKIVYMPVTEENGFSPSLPTEKVDLIYLCFPNNPTGTVIDKSGLKKWVDYAKQNKAIILFDAAYEAFITDPDIPHSIFEIEGARDVAIEFRSFSKTAGFTGTRLAYTVIPEELMGYDKSGARHSLHALWNRRHNTKFNGVSYPVQTAAAACYSEAGRLEIDERIKYYLNNASIIKKSLAELGFTVYGGDHSPYVWMKTKNEQSSWDFFDQLLNDLYVVGTPGAGFGSAGEGFFRFSAFADIDDVEEAMERIKSSGF